MKPAAAIIPKSDPSWEMGKYGPIWPKTPACYGFTLIAKIKPGTAETIRSYGLAWRLRWRRIPTCSRP